MCVCGCRMGCACDYGHKLSRQGVCVCVCVCVCVASDVLHIVCVLVCMCCSALGHVAALCCSGRKCVVVRRSAVALDYMECVQPIALSLSLSFPPSLSRPCVRLLSFLLRRREHLRTSPPPQVTCWPRTSG